MRPMMIGTLLGALLCLGIRDVAEAQTPLGAATADSAAVDEVTAKLTKAADPQAAFKALSPTQQAAFNDRTKSESVTIDSEKVDQDEAASDAKAGKTCWKGEVRGRGINKVGGTLYTYWVQGRWCATGGRVTVADFTRGDGETKTPFWRFAGRDKGMNEINGNQARIWTKFHFIMGVGGWDIQNPDHCLRLSGDAQGKMASKSTCSPF